jgi:spore maturation protein SpmB
MKKAKRKKSGGAFRLLLIAAYSVLLIRHSDEIAEGIHSALTRCVNVIVPALFAFLAAADMLVRGGAYIYLSAPFRPLAWLTGLPEELCPVLVLSNVAGYPAGASVIRTMCESGRLDSGDASRLMCFCFNAGPAFLVGVLGQRRGLAVWLIIFAVNILAAAVICRVRPLKASAKAENVCSPGGDLLTGSVSAAGRALFKVCGMIMLFSTFLTLINCCLGRFGLKIGVFAPILEISELGESASAGLWSVCAAGAFGGVCVLLQIKAIIGSAFSLMPFFAARVICAVMAGVIAVFAERYLLSGETLPTAAQYAAQFAATEQGSVFPTICLIMMIVLTLVSVKKAESRK